MKALPLLFFLAVFATVSVGQTANRVEVPLNFKKFQNAGEMITLTLGGVTNFFDVRPPKGYSPFTGAIKPVFFQLRLEDVTLTGVLARSSAKAKSYDRLWVDWNGDKKFTGDEKLMGTETVKGEEKFVVFGPVERTLNERKLEAFFLVHGDYHIHIVPAGYYEGETELNGRNFKLGLTDGNMNGVLGDKAAIGAGLSGSGWGGDVLLVDFDGDGVFGIQKLAEAAFLFGEVYYLTHLVQLPDGNFYRIKVSEDGSKLLLERDNSPTGKVKMVCKRFTLGLMGQEGNLVVRGQDGECLLSTGVYQTQWAVIAEADEQGKLWQALLFFYRQSPRFRVTKDKPADLPFGPPFKLVLDVGREGKKLEFSLSLEDKSGNSVNAIFTPDMEQPKEPNLVITDMKGKVVKTEKFHHG
ncbi:MAG: hypothetical protein RMK89_02260 [Armatimonadota bacterium]|nr:hypothetical protein [Armatimonadota bacterium]MDW8142265.1 hypothetical protein [Armatimonadota bacterium]